MSKVTPHKVLGPEWTDARVDELTRLWDAGWSATRIAQRIGGVTRNAVIGKLHRLGLKRGTAATLYADTSWSSWNDERDELLKELYRAGLQDPEIVVEMGAVSVNAVAKRRAKLGLLRAPAGGFRPKPMKAFKPQAAKPKLIITGNGTVLEKPEGHAPKVSVIGDAWAPLLGVAPMLREHARDRHCKWPITVDGDEPSWCCSAVATEGPYCKAHQRKSVRPNQPEEIKRAKRRAEREKSHARMIFGRAA